VALVTRSQVIKRPVNDVFATVVDGGNFATWNPTVRSSRMLSDGDIGDGTRFEWKLNGFGTVIQELREFQRDQQVRIVPLTRILGGGHRFKFTDRGDHTRIDHELEMIPKGFFKLTTPIIVVVGRKNLRDTAHALQHHLENS